MYLVPLQAKSCFYTLKKSVLRSIRAIRVPCVRHTVQIRLPFNPLFALLNQLLVIGHYKLVILHWPLVIINWPLAIKKLVIKNCPLPTVNPLRL
jgi:hypothetical protein